MDRDEKDLRNLSWAHYAVGAITALMALPFIVGVWLGIDFIRHPVEHQEAILWFQNGLTQGQELELPPDMLGQLIAFFFGSIALLVLLHAAVVAWIGLCLAKARRYWVVYIFSILDCTYVPFGTIIGVWAVVVLNRPSVKRRFGLKTPTPKAPVKT